MAEDPKQTMVSFNEAIDLISNLTSGKLKDLLKTRLGEVAQCTGLCDCNVRYCACNGSVTAIAADTRILPWEDYSKIRDSKVQELQQQIKLLEGKG
jgi:hypothetical protein